jgi:predicted nucleic acid-binding protein
VEADRMSFVVLDTDVASKIIKNQLRAPLSPLLVGLSWCVTFVTVGELWQWAEVRGWGQPSRSRLEHWLENVVVIDSDDQVSRTWGQMSAFARKRGRPRPANDSWIAACCLSRNVPLATGNIKDYADYAEPEGLRLITV